MPEAVDADACDSRPVPSSSTLASYLRNRDLLNSLMQYLAVKPTSSKKKKLYSCGIFREERPEITTLTNAGLAMAQYRLHGPVHVMRRVATCYRDVQLQN